MKTAAFPTLKVLLAVLCLVLAMVAVPTSAAVQENTFANIKNDQRQSVVMFYYSSNPEHLQKLDIVRAVSDKVSNEFPQLIFQSCDGDLEANRADYQEAGFKGGFFVFTQLEGQGIEKYTHEVDENTLIKHIRNLFASFDPSDVGGFVDEDTFYEELDQDAANRPVVVKFFENWCTHCRALKKPYNIAATQLKNKARFIEIECSKNDQTKQFCAKHEARAFPVMKIFSSEKSLKFELDSRSVINIEKFVDTFIQGGGSSAPAVRSSSSGAKPVASASSGSVKPSTLADTPSQASLFDQDTLVNRVSSLERALEALTARLEKVEKRK